MKHTIYEGDRQIKRVFLKKQLLAEDVMKRAQTNAGGTGLRDKRNSTSKEPGVRESMTFSIISKKFI